MSLQVKRRRSAKVEQKSSLREIPSIQSNVLTNHTFRFTSSSGTATVITPVSILGACGVFTNVANTTVTCYNGSFKLHSVKVWTPPATQGSSATCSIDWAGNSGLATTTNSEISDTTVSTAIPAFIKAVPPKGCLASFWQNSSVTTGLFILTAPSGSIIDLNVTTVVNDADFGPTNITVATAVIGTNYFLSLDPNTTHRFTPVSLTTTI